MATVKHNDLIEGMSGKFGNDLVFRTMRGKTFVSPPPRKPNKKKESVAQRSTRTTFKEAAAWAQDILQDDVKKAYYRERAKTLNLPNAYTAAITDYMRKPKIITMEQQNVVTCSVRKPGYTLPKVSVRIDKTDTLATVVNIQQSKTDWFIQVVKRDADQHFSIFITTMDNADCERIEEIRV